MSRSPVVAARSGVGGRRLGGWGHVAAQVTVPEVGAGPVPRKPNAVEAPAARRPFHATFLAVTVVPEVVTSADHACATAPPVGSVNVVDQPSTADVPAVTVTAAW